MKKPPLRWFETQNFKAIRDSGRVEFGWLTVFIGNNGAGKSSLVEALETYRDVVLDGVDAAFLRWRGYEHALNKSSSRSLKRSAATRPRLTHPMAFHSRWRWEGKDLECRQSIAQGEDDSLFFEKERIIQRRTNRTDRWTRNDRGELFLEGERPGQKLPRARTPRGARWASRANRERSGQKPARAKLPKLPDGASMLKQFAWESFERWQFLFLNPERMGQPSPQQRAGSSVKLARDGSNVAEYLIEIRGLDPDVFEEILGAPRYVLPYAADLRPTFTSELERAFYLKLNEDSYDVPGWVLSTGTLRTIALLAALRHPQPPPLLVVEEIENGLDPRTLHLIVEEIRAAVTAGTTQVILTTHSPYLLDLLDLSQIVVVERDAGQAVFRRPDARQLEEWSDAFSPGRLYTMGRLTGASQ